MEKDKFIRLPLKWRKPLNELELATLRPYEPNLNMRGRIADVIARVTAAGERIRERKRAELEQAERESIEQMLRERRERLSAPPAPVCTVIPFQPAATKVKRRRRRAKVISLKRA